MSAYVVSDAHINALITFAVANHVSYFDGDKRVDINAKSASKVGKVLLHENERSVNTRYNQAATKSPFKFVPSPTTYSPVAIIKAAHCLDYQSCETEDWKDSVAFKVLAAIKDKAEEKLPGYAGAPWSID